MRGNLFENTKILFATTAAAGSTVVTTRRIDMAGYEGVMFIMQLSSKAAQEDNYHFRAQGSAADSTTGAIWYQNIVTRTSARPKSSASNINRNINVGDVYKPSHRYVRGQFYSTAAGADSTGDSRIGGIAILYGPRWADSTRFTGLYSTHVGLGGVVIGATS